MRITHGGNGGGNASSITVYVCRLQNDKLLSGWVYVYDFFTPIFKGLFLRMLQRQGANQLALASPNYLPMQLVCTLPWQSCLLVSFMWDFFSLYWYSSSWNVMQQWHEWWQRSLTKQQPQTHEYVLACMVMGLWIVISLALSSSSDWGLTTTFLHLYAQ